MERSRNGVRVEAKSHLNLFAESLNGPGGSKKPCIYEGLFHVSDWFPTLQNFAKANRDYSVELDGIDHAGNVSRTYFSRLVATKKSN